MYIHVHILHIYVYTIHITHTYIYMCIHLNAYTKIHIFIRISYINCFYYCPFDYWRTLYAHAHTVHTHIHTGGRRRISSACAGVCACECVCGGIHTRVLSHTWMIHVTRIDKSRHARLCRCIYRRHSFTFVAWLIYISDILFPYFKGNSIICVTWQKHSRKTSAPTFPPKGAFLTYEAHFTIWTSNFAYMNESCHAYFGGK